MKVDRQARALQSAELARQEQARQVVTQQQRDAARLQAVAEEQKAKTERQRQAKGM